MKRTGYVLIEVLVAAAIVGLLLGTVVTMVGDNRQRLQQQQLNLAAQKFMMEARRVQQYNMYVKGENRLKMVVTAGKNYYTVGVIGTAAQQQNFADEGCGDIIFASSAEILFSPLGSVNKSDYIILQHREDPSMKITLNLQPVTGRIEREALNPN